MKLIKAYIRQRKIEDVYSALKKEGFSSMTFVACEGTGDYTDNEKKHISEKYPFASAYRVIKLEILVADENVIKVIDTVKEKGRTGYSGDGIIIISPVDEVYKVRTNESGINAI